MEPSPSADQAPIPLSDRHAVGHRHTPRHNHGVQHEIGMITPPVGLNLFRHRRHHRPVHHRWVGGDSVADRPSRVPVIVTYVPSLSIVVPRVHRSPEGLHYSRQRGFAHVQEDPFSVEINDRRPGKRRGGGGGVPAALQQAQAFGPSSVLTGCRTCRGRGTSICGRCRRRLVKATKMGLRVHRKAH
jgi:hypothetical protein